jgi:hypothetical protein
MEAKQEAPRRGRPPRLMEDATIDTNTPVHSAVLHSAVIIAGKTETHLNQAKYPGCKLSLVSTPVEGLLMEHKGKSILIPAAGIKAAYLA